MSTPALGHSRAIKCFASTKSSTSQKSKGAAIVTFADTVADGDKVIRFSIRYADGKEHDIELPSGSIMSVHRYPDQIELVPLSYKLKQKWTEIRIVKVPETDEPDFLLLAAILKNNVSATSWKDHLDEASFSQPVKADTTVSQKEKLRLSRCLLTEDSHRDKLIASSAAKRKSGGYESLTKPHNNLCLSLKKKTPVAVKTDAYVDKDPIEGDDSNTFSNSSTQRESEQRRKSAKNSHGNKALSQFISTSKSSSNSGIRMPLSDPMRQKTPFKPTVSFTSPFFESNCSSPSTVRTSRQGIANLGNTCYMSSVFQFLGSCFKFQISLLEFVQNYEHVLGNESLSKLLLNLFEEMKDNGVVRPKNLKALMGKINPRFQHNDQEDAHECLQTALNQISTEVEDCIIQHIILPERKTEGRTDKVINSDSPPSDQENFRLFGSSKWPKLSLEEKKKLNELKFQIDPITFNFYFRIQRRLVCQKCSNELISEEEFTDLSIPIPTQATSNRIDLDSMLGDDFRCAILEYNCEKCHHPRSLVYQRFTHLPIYLLLHFKRFKYANATMIKIHDEVDFGLKLNIGKWCTDGIKVGYRSDLRIFHDPLLKDSRSSAIIENNADISADTDIIIPNWISGSNPFSQKRSSVPKSQFQLKLELSKPVKSVLALTEDEQIQFAINESLNEKVDLAMAVKSIDTRIDGESKANLETQESQKSTSASHISENFSNINAVYTIKSIVSHLGFTPSSGHYICDIYSSKDKSWKKFDDSKLEVTTRQRNVDVRKDAYLVAFVFKKEVSSGN